MTDRPMGIPQEWVDAAQRATEVSLNRADPHLVTIHALGAVTAVAPLIEADLRTRLADALDAHADEQYPESVFTPGSTQPDGVAGTAMRHAYHQAARMIRDGWPDNEDHS